jgi:hypothetical protein
VNIIIFSKDRAAQLDLFLRSFQSHVKNATNYQIKILYTFSNKEFEKGYNLLISKYINFNILFKLENDFKKDLIEIVYLLKHTVFFVDDNIFIRDFNFYDNQQDIFESDNNILCRSLRLNYYLDYCYSIRSIIKSIPKFDKNGVFYWKNMSSDYGYPMSLDGHIFRTKEILPLLESLEYKNPNSLEGQLTLHPINLPKMICYFDSKIINNPINRVQTNNFNHCGSISAITLNERFLNGKILDLKYDNIKNTACHMELSL